MESFLLTSRHEQILREVALCRFMKIEQLNELFFSRGSLTYMRGIVNELILEKNKKLQAENKGGYLRVIDTKRVGDRYLFGLDKRGVHYLRKTGMDIHYYPSEHKSISSDNLPHLLYTNNIVVAAAKLPSIIPSFQVVERRHYLSNPQKRGRNIPLPDAWIHVIEKERTHYAFWEEVDRGTEEEGAIRGKVDDLINFVESGAYEKEYGIPALSVRFRTPKGTYRMQCLQRWVENRLDELGRPQYKDFFHFSLLAEGPLNPVELFFEVMQ